MATKAVKRRGIERGRVSTGVIRKAGRPLKAGVTAPNFTLKASDGKHFTLSGYRVKFKVILFFFDSVRDNGRIEFLKSLRDNKEWFKQFMTFVVGISRDSIQLNTEIVRKYMLPFPLLSDVDMSIAEKYGAFTDARKNPLIKPATFVIDEQGIIRKSYENVADPGHIQDVYDYVRELHEGFDDIFKKISLITEEDF